MTLDDYILQHTSPEPDYLYRLWRATNLQTIHGRMVSGHLQGRLLKMLVQMIQPRYVLEVGTFSGYSAIAMAEGLPADGHLYTFEINDEMEDFTRPWIEQSSVANKITFIIVLVAILLPTTHCGTVMSLMLTMTTTSRHRAFAASTTMWPRTHGRSRSSCHCAMD